MFCATTQGRKNVHENHVTALNVLLVCLVRNVGVSQESIARRQQNKKKVKPFHL